MADEVRKLAERTSASTRVIANTIVSMQSSANAAVQGMQDAVGKVSQGVSRATHTSEAIRNIGMGSNQAVVMVGEISVAIREQGTAANTIAVHVEKVAQMAEQTSAVSLESARTARDLDQLALRMQQIVSRYRI